MGLWPVCSERWTPGLTTSFLIRSLNSPKKSFVDIKSPVRLEGIIKCQFSSVGIGFQEETHPLKTRGAVRGPWSQHALMPDICRTPCDLQRASVSIIPFDHLPRNLGRGKPSSWEHSTPGETEAENGSNCPGGRARP